jgi:hypothetical protein
VLYPLSYAGGDGKPSPGRRPIGPYSSSSYSDSAATSPPPAPHSLISM